MFCLASGRLAMPSQMARLLVQVFVQGEGEANAPLCRAHRLTFAISVASRERRPSGPEF